MVDELGPNGYSLWIRRTSCRFAPFPTASVPLNPAEPQPSGPVLRKQVVGNFRSPHCCVCDAAPRCTGEYPLPRVRCVSHLFVSNRSRIVHNHPRTPALARAILVASMIYSQVCHNTFRSTLLSVLCATPRLCVCQESDGGLARNYSISTAEPSVHD